MFVICIFGQTKCAHGVDRTSHCRDSKKSAWLEKVSAAAVFHVLLIWFYTFDK